MTLRKLKKKMFQVAVFWKKNNSFSLFSTPTCPKSIFPLLTITPSICKWVWVVTVELQLTHLKTPICVGHLALLTYFLPFLSVTQISPTWKSGPSQWSTDSRGVSCYLNWKLLGRLAFQVSVYENTGCISLTFISCSPLNGEQGALCSLSIRKWNLPLKSKVLQTVS